MYIILFYVTDINLSEENIFVTEFGFFVDSYGRRSRTDEIKWSRVPLSFGKCSFSSCLKVLESDLVLNHLFFLSALSFFKLNTFLPPMQPTESRTCLSPTSTPWMSLKFRDTQQWGETNQSLHNKSKTLCAW